MCLIERWISGYFQRSEVKQGGPSYHGARGGGGAAGRVRGMRRRRADDSNDGLHRRMDY
jgi:hypothetical protein